MQSATAGNRDNPSFVFGFKNRAVILTLAILARMKHEYSAYTVQTGPLSPSALSVEAFRVSLTGKQNIQLQKTRITLVFTLLTSAISGTVTMWYGPVPAEGYPIAIAEKKANNLKVSVFFLCYGWKTSRQI